MSKNIIIQKAGLPQSLTVDALRLKTQGGGTEDWVPADGKNLVELQIGGSGTYKASDYNAYGIAVVRVEPKYGGGATSKAAEHDFTEKHTPSIKEGNKSYNFSAVMLKTNLQGGGTCLWIPRMDVELKSKYITKSGTYAAKADNCYGFDQVTVSGVDVEITQDEDGNDVAEITDGDRTITVLLPSSIVCDPPPTFTGPYSVGQTINYSGMVVKAYMRNGTLWTDTNGKHPGGVIGNKELILPATVDPSWEREYDKAGSDFDLSPLPNPISVANGGFVNSGEYSSGSYKYKYSYTFTPHPEKTVRTIASHASDNDSLLRPFMASDSRGEIGMLHYYREQIAPTQQVMDDRTTFLRANSEYTYDGKTVYWYNGSGITVGSRENDTSEGVPDYLWPTNSSVQAAELAWTMIYGDYEQGGCKVPVQWKRPVDDMVLETSFDIELSGS